MPFLHLKSVICQPTPHIWVFDEKGGGFVVIAFNPGFFRNPTNRKWSNPVHLPGVIFVFRTPFFSVRALEIGPKIGRFWPKSENPDLADFSGLLRY